jgi:hypothetical protein
MEYGCEGFLIHTTTFLEQGNTLVQPKPSHFTQLGAIQYKLKFLCVKCIKRTKWANFHASILHEILSHQSPLCPRAERKIYMKKMLMRDTKKALLVPDKPF